MCDSLNWLLSYLVLPFFVSAYASVVVSRIYQFHDAKREAWKRIITMEDVLSKDSHTLKHPRADAWLNIPTQRIRYLGHADAANILKAIAEDISKKLAMAEKALSNGTASIQIPRKEWEERIVPLKCNWPAIFKPWPVKF